MEELEFHLNRPYIELAKLLKLMSLVGTGGEAKIRIQSGEVLVDGEVETRRGKKITAGSTVTFDTYRIRVLSTENK